MNEVSPTGNTWSTGPNSKSTSSRSVLCVSACVSVSSQEWSLCGSVQKSSLLHACGHCHEVADFALMLLVVLIDARQTVKVHFEVSSLHCDRTPSVLQRSKSSTVARCHQCVCSSRSFLLPASVSALSAFALQRPYKSFTRDTRSTSAFLSPQPLMLDLSFLRVLDRPVFEQSSFPISTNVQRSSTPIANVVVAMIPCIRRASVGMICILQQFLPTKSRQFIVVNFAT